MFKNIVLTFLMGSQLYAAPSFIGFYDLDVVIGNQLFKDTLEIKSIQQNHIDGLFSVPGVFTSHFYGELNELKIVGTFIARERGKKFEVELKGRFEKNGLMKGSLYQSGVKFADFSGSKRREK